MGGGRRRGSDRKWNAFLAKSGRTRWGTRCCCGPLKRLCCGPLNHLSPRWLRWLWITHNQVPGSSSTRGSTLAVQESTEDPSQSPVSGLSRMTWPGQPHLFPGAGGPWRVCRTHFAFVCAVSYCPCLMLLSVLTPFLGMFVIYHHPARDYRWKIACMAKSGTFTWWLHDVNCRARAWAHRRRVQTRVHWPVPLSL